MNRRGFLKALIAAPVARALPWSGIAAFVAPVAPDIAADIRLTLSEIVAATIAAHRAEVIRNIQANNALFQRLQHRNQAEDRRYGRKA